jgi:hypothetical protein
LVFHQRLLSSMGSQSPETNETCSGTRIPRRTQNASAAMNQQISERDRAIVPAGCPRAGGRRFVQAGIVVESAAWRSLSSFRTSC